MSSASASISAERKQPRGRESHRQVRSARALLEACRCARSTSSHTSRTAPRPAARGGDVVHAAAHRFGRLARRAGEAAARAAPAGRPARRPCSRHRCSLQALLFDQQFFKRRKLVVDALQHVLDAELGGARAPPPPTRARRAARRRRRSAAASSCRGRRARRTPSAPRRRDRRQACRRSARRRRRRSSSRTPRARASDFGRELRCDALQITLARKRSCMLSAPTSAPRSSTTSSWLTLWLLHDLHRLDRERLGADGARHRRSSPRRCARPLEVDALLQRAAQVAVGEDAAHRARRRRPPRSCRCARASSPATACMAPAPLCTCGHVVAAAHDVGARATSAWRGSWPRGWLRAKSSAEKPRLSSSATASASPSASAAVVLAVGARLCGQASCATPASRCTSASRASAESRLAGERDQLGAAALHQRHDLQQLLARAGVRDGDEHVAALDHAEVAVARLGRMHEVRRRAGAGEGRGDLARDVAGLAHAAHHHAALALVDELDRGRRNCSSMRAISARTASASISSTRRASSSGRARCDCVSPTFGRCLYHALGSIAHGP